MPDLTYDLMSVQAVTLQENESLFSFLRQPSTLHCPHLLPCALLWLSAGQQLVAIACAQGSQQQTYHVLLQQANGTDRQTDGRTADGFVDASRQ